MSLRADFWLGQLLKVDYIQLLTHPTLSARLCIWHIGDFQTSFQIKLERTNIFSMYIVCVIGFHNSTLLTTHNFFLEMKKLIHSVNGESRSKLQTCLIPNWFSVSKLCIRDVCLLFIELLLVQFSFYCCGDNDCLKKWEGFI